MEKHLFSALVPCSMILGVLVLVWWLVRFGGLAKIQKGVTRLRKRLNDWDRQCGHHADLTNRHPEIDFRRQH